MLPYILTLVKDNSISIRMLVGWEFERRYRPVHSENGGSGAGGAWVFLRIVFFFQDPLPKEPNCSLTVGVSQ